MPDVHHYSDHLSNAIREFIRKARSAKSNGNAKLSISAPTKKPPTLPSRPAELPYLKK